MTSKNAKNLNEKRQKVAKSCFGTDEVVVARISKSRSNAPTSEGLHIVSNGKVLQVQKTMILLTKHNPKGLHYEEPYESRGSRTVLREV
jgi:hypothetical protein